MFEYYSVHQGTPFSNDKKIMWIRGIRRLISDLEDQQNEDQQDQDQEDLSAYVV